MKYFVIGISGTTCSGKTSIAKRLHENFKDSILINQDDYFLLEDDSRHTLIPELNHLNWEILSSLDMQKMYDDIKTTIKQAKKAGNSCNEIEWKIIILEGFTIYNYKPVAELCHRKYFIEISEEVCWNRRKHRVYNPPDVPGYFDKVVWPEYLRHKSEIHSNTNLSTSITFLDGNKSLDVLYNEIAADVKTYLNQIETIK